MTMTIMDLPSECLGQDLATKVLQLRQLPSSLLQQCLSVQWSGHTLISATKNLKHIAGQKDEAMSGVPSQK